MDLHERVVRRVDSVCIGETCGAEVIVVTDSALVTHSYNPRVAIVTDRRMDNFVTRTRMMGMKRRRERVVFNRRRGKREATASTKSGMSPSIQMISKGSILCQLQHRVRKSMCILSCFTLFTQIEIRTDRALVANATDLHTTPITCRRVNKESLSLCRTLLRDRSRRGRRRRRGGRWRDLQAEKKTRRT